MKLIIDTVNIISLEANEFLEYHDGRDGHPFNLDASICGIKDVNRAHELIALLTSFYVFAPRYKIEQPVVYSKAPNTSFEVLFSMSDFLPIITC